MTLTPSVAGEITITASFLAKQLEDVDGYLAVDVLEREKSPVNGEEKVETTEILSEEPPAVVSEDKKDGEEEEEVEMNEGE